MHGAQRPRLATLLPPRSCLTPRARDILADGRIWRCRSAPPCAPLCHVSCVAGPQQGAGIALIGCVDDREGGELTVTCLGAVSGD
jgi:hypothetical protein